MTLSEFVEEYYLHDSNIEKVEYVSTTKTVLLEINFAFWMQEWYNEKDQPESGMIRIVFHNVDKYDCGKGNPTGPFVTILKSELKGRRLVISLFDNYVNKGFEMIIDAETVEVFT